MPKVLLVENNKIFREAFKHNLCRYFPALIIEEAVDGEEALKKIKASPPALVFTDMSLSGMNGLQLTQKIKKNFPNIPIAILTGYDLPEYKEAALRYGAEHFFIKESLKWDEVEALVKSVAK